MGLGWTEGKEDWARVQERGAERLGGPWERAKAPRKELGYRVEFGDPQSGGRGSGDRGEREGRLWGTEGLGDRAQGWEARKQVRNPQRG